MFRAKFDQKSLQNKKALAPSFVTHGYIENPSFLEDLAKKNKAFVLP
jgi:hypothetical protein